jgi:predicted metal-dependent hydrolase
VSKKQIEIWVYEKKSWVDTQLNKQLTIIDLKQYPFKTHQICIFSHLVNLQFEQATYSEVKQHTNSLKITCSSRVKHSILKYQALLEEYLNEMLTAYIEMRLAYFCQIMGEQLPHDLRIRIYKRRWGSCNSKRELTFNLQLVGAPKHIIDYVIVHELSHLRYLNHSSAFWQRVAQFYPDYKTASQWLKSNGQSLQWIFE